MNIHSQSDIHRLSLIADVNFLRVAKYKVKPITCACRPTSFVSQVYADRIALNRSIMKLQIEMYWCALDEVSQDEDISGTAPNTGGATKDV